MIHLLAVSLLLFPGTPLPCASWVASAVATPSRGLVTAQGDVVPKLPPPGSTPPASPSPEVTPGTSNPSSPTPDTSSPLRPGPGVGGPAGSGPGTPTPAPSQPSPFSPFTLAGTEASWALWWEHNKLEFLPPHPLPPDARGADDVGRTSTSHLDFLRRMLEPIAENLAAHPDARLRAAAAGALGRFGGETQVERLRPLLKDTNPNVQEAALLGLGASGRRKAQSALIELAREGRLDGKEHSRRSRALAVLALALGRTCGFDAAADEVALAVATKGSRSDRHELGIAALTYALLVPNPELVELAEKLAHDKGLPMPLRSRALEVLRVRADGDSLAGLQKLLSGSRIELRQTAALTLGEFEHPLTVTSLLAARKEEQDLLSSSFLLLSLGRRGGVEVREPLLAALADSARRPWAALALGLLARRHPDADVTTALLTAAARESSAETRPALWLALGLSRDPRAASVLVEALQRSSEPRARLYAAQALALDGSDECRRALVAQLARERSPLVRSEVALALGVLGVPEDIDRLLAALDTLAEPALQAQVVTAIAYHGSTKAVTELARLVASDKLDVSARAAALDGLAMRLGRTMPLSLGRTSRSANFTLFPEWLVAACGTTF